MNTALMLAARHDGLSVLPIETVVADYFPHLAASQFRAQVRAGKIQGLPIMRMTDSQKSQGVHIEHLAKFIEERKREAEAEARKLNGGNQ